MIKFNPDFLNYKYKDNFIYKINPILKLLFLLVTAIFLLLLDHQKVGYLVVFIILIFFFKIAEYKMRKLLRIIKLLSVFYISSVLMQVLFKQYNEIIDITYLFFKFSLICMSLSLFIVTTSFKDMLYSFRKFVNYKIIFTVMISIRFIPLLLNRLNEIYHLQKMRNGKLKMKDFFKLKKLISYLIPIFTYTLNLSDNISKSIHSKGFGYKDKRTYLLDYKTKINK